MRTFDRFCASGTITVVRGSSGSGKTRFLQCISGLRAPNVRSRGSIRLWDTCASASFLRRNVTYIDCDSDATLMQTRGMLTVESYLRMHAMRSAPQAVDALERIDLRDILHVPLRQLSTGQRRRVTIYAATLLRKPVLVIDEPMANLDTANTSLMLRLLTDFASASSRTPHMVVISHHGNDANFVDDGYQVMDFDEMCSTCRSPPDQFCVPRERGRDCLMDACAASTPHYPALSQQTVRRGGQRRRGAWTCVRYCF